MKALTITTYYDPEANIDMLRFRFEVEHEEPHTYDIPTPDFVEAFAPVAEALARKNRPQT